MKEESTFKDKITSILVLFFLGALLAWCLWMGLAGLVFSEKHPMEQVFRLPVYGDMYDGEIPYVSGRVIEKNRTINSRWAGTEYFYVVLSEDKSQAILVRTTKHWGDGLGNDEYNKVFKQANGIVKELRFKTRERLSNTFAELEGAGIRVEKRMYLDLLGRSICYAALFEGVSILLWVIYVLCLLKKARSVNAKPLPKAIHVFMLVLLALMFAVLLFLRNKI